MISKTWFFNFPVQPKARSTFEKKQAAKTFCQKSKCLHLAEFIALASENDHFYLGEIQYDRELKFYHLLKNSREPIILNKSNVIGLPVVYCPLSGTGGETVTFLTCKYSSE